MNTSNPAITPASAALRERVLKVKEINKLKNTKIADISGINRSTISNQLQGNWNLDVRVLLAVAELSPNISAEWLLRGKGDILAEPIETRLAHIEDLLLRNN